MSTVALSTAVRGLSSSQIELLKWVGLIAMLADHVNRAAFDMQLVGWSEFGRLAFPCFALALAFGLREAAAEHVYRVVLRLLIWGCVALPVTLWMWGWAQLNVLFTLAAGLVGGYAVVGSLGLGGRYEALLRIVMVCSAIQLGFICEFWLFGVFMVAAAVIFARSGSWEALGVFAASLAFLLPVNGNHWALLALPVLAVVSLVDVRIPRLRRVFYWIYPVHLLLIGLVVGAN